MGCQELWWGEEIFAEDGSQSVAGLKVWQWESTCKLCDGEKDALKEKTKPYPDGRNTNSVFGS